MNCYLKLIARCLCSILVLPFTLLGTLMTLALKLLFDMFDFVTGTEENLTDWDVIKYLFLSGFQPFIDLYKELRNESN